VRHAVLALEEPDPLELDVLRTGAVEQPASLSEQYRDDVELELVEDARRQGELCDRGPVHRDVFLAGACLALIMASSTSLT
jgi:hypothetical protein